MDWPTFVRGVVFILLGLMIIGVMLWYWIECKEVLKEDPQPEEPCECGNELSCDTARGYFEVTRSVTERGEFDEKISRCFEHRYGKDRHKA